MSYILETHTKSDLCRLHERLEDGRVVERAFSPMNTKRWSLTSAGFLHSMGAATDSFCSEISEEEATLILFEANK